MSLIDLLLNLLLGLAMGTVGGLFGIGGGLVAIPALGVLFGLDQQLAQGTALVMVVPNVVLALWRYNQRNRIEPKHALLLSVTGFCCAWLACWNHLASQKPRRVTSRNTKEAGDTWQAWPLIMP